MSRLKSSTKFHKLALVVPILFAFVLPFHSAAKGQEAVTKKISIIKSYPKDVTPPIEFHGLKIDGKPMGFNTAFNGANDFLEKVSFDVTNRSGKKITHIQFLIYLYTKYVKMPGIDKVKSDLVFSLPYGRPNREGIAPFILLNEGETLPVSTARLSSEPAFSALLERIRSMGPNIITVGIDVQIVAFDDGSYWNFDGKTYPKLTQTSMQLKNSGQASIGSKACGRLTNNTPANWKPYGLERSFFYSDFSVLLMPGMSFNIQSPCQEGCFDTQGNEDMTCDAYCYGTRENWYNPNYPNYPGPATSGHWTITESDFLFCYDYLQHVCGGGQGCTKDFTCLGGGGCDPEMCDAGYAWCSSQCQCIPTYQYCP